MSELANARDMLEGAERAAIGGDFSSADDLLRGAARIQEAELGPFHPDLVNTLNNLAIVAEKAGRPGDAEKFYRRAAAIASAALPPDDPIVAESRQNLDDFCRERGLPIDAGQLMTPLAPALEPGLDALAPVVAPIPRTHAPTTDQPLKRAAPRSSRQLAWAATGAIVLVAAAVLTRQPGSSDEPATPAETMASAPSAVTEPAPPPDPASIERPQPPKAVLPASSARSSGDIKLTAAQLCQTFSTSGGTWRCDPPGDSVAQGTLVLYTRVRSPRDATVVHRWYREDTLQRAVKLPVRANELDGFRTYSRQRVDAVGDWRVEVSSADGDLLHEQRFAVR